MCGNKNSGRRPAVYSLTTVGEAHALRAVGLSLLDIGRELHLSPLTVKRLLAEPVRPRINGGHGRAQSYKDGCRCDYCRAAITFSAPYGDPRHAVACWCGLRMMLVMPHVIADCRTISCGSARCDELESRARAGDRGYAGT